MFSLHEFHFLPVAYLFRCILKQFCIGIFNTEPSLLFARPVYHSAIEDLYCPSGIILVTSVIFFKFFF